MKTGACRVLAGLVGAALLVAGALPAAAQPVASAWPLFHQNAQRTGRSTVNGPAAVINTRVVFEGFASFRSTPAIGPNGELYVGSGRQLCQVDPDPMADPMIAEWCTDVGGTIKFASPAVGIDTDPMNPGGHLIYIGARDNRLHAVDQTGVVKWTHATGIDGDVATAPVIAPLPSGAIFYGGVTRIHGINPMGVLQWMQPLDSYIFTASPALATGPTGRVYVATLKGYLYAIAPEPPGTIQWSLKVGKNIKYAAPAVGPDGTIYCGTRNGIVAVTDNGMTGTLKWEFTVPGRGMVSTPAIDTDGKIYVGSQGSVSGGGAAFYALQDLGTSANMLWVYQTSRFFRGSPAIDPAGRVYATSGSEVIAFNKVSGTPVWTFATGRNIYSSPIIDANGTLYIASGDRNVYAIDD